MPQNICIEEAAFFVLIDKVLEHVLKNPDTQTDRWITSVEAMVILKIKSETTLQKLRDEGKIRASQEGKRMILYDRNSIIDYLEDFAYETFDLP